MIIHRYPKTDYLKFENSSENKILLNICDDSDYNVTDSNLFWSNYYTKIEKDFKKQPFKKIGDVFYTEILSYQIVCNMICVDWTKTYYNLKTFKLKYFQKCCYKCYDYMKNHDINIIYTPKLGTEILEGNWNEILNTLINVFHDCTLYLFYTIE